MLRCEKGYRAQYAYPVSLKLHTFGLMGRKKMAASLDRKYGVPVE